MAHDIALMRRAEPIAQVIGAAIVPRLTNLIVINDRVQRDIGISLATEILKDGGADQGVAVINAYMGHLAVSEKIGRDAAREFAYKYAHNPALPKSLQFMFRAEVDKIDEEIDKEKAQRAEARAKAWGKGVLKEISSFRLEGFAHHVVIFPGDFKGANRPAQPIWLTRRGNPGHRDHG